MAVLLPLNSICKGQGTSAGLSWQPNYFGQGHLQQRHSNVVVSSCSRERERRTQESKCSVSSEFPTTCSDLKEKGSRGRRSHRVHAKSGKKGRKKQTAYEHVEVHDAFVSNDAYEVEFLPTQNDLEVLPTQVPVEARLARVAPPRVPSGQNTQAGVGVQQYAGVPLPRVLLLHTGGTLGMDPKQSYMDEGAGNVQLKEGTGGVYPASDNLQPGEVLSDLLTAVPELTNFAHLDVEIVFNIDSCRIGPRQWVQLAKLLDKQRQNYDAFLIVHGTDTMSFTAAALSLMLQGFKKPIVLTGSQLPLAMPRSDARQNLIDAITCATAACLSNPMSRYPVHFEEVAICFGGKLLRGNRARKVHSSVYDAFDTPMYPHLAKLGVEIEWNHARLLQASDDVYQPRFKLNQNVIRVPIVPGVNPKKAYGDLYDRGVRGIVLEAFGVGNMPDNKSHGWLPWLKQQRKKGLLVYLCSQCSAGNLHPELYRSGSVALNMGVESGRQMTPECAVIKMMFCLEYKDIPLSQPIAGEL